MKNKIIHGDCLEVMKDIEDKSIDLIITDPPYNIKKAEWDKWKKQENYIDWLGGVFKECDRVLKDNGSFYFFHNDFLQMVELQNYINNNTRFVFKNLLIWNKRFNGVKNKGFLDGFVEVEHLRNYQQMAEYCLFYVKQASSKWDKTGLEVIKHDVNNFQPLRQYFKEFQQALGLTKKAIIEQVGQRVDHCFRHSSSQWDLPTKETYVELCKIPLKNKFVRKEYEELRKEYEELRYTFNNQKTSHSVMNYEIAKKQGHITPKPVDLIENIIKHSSNEDFTILDPFIGSGTTAISCLNTNRNYIGIEKEPEYVEIANKRIADELSQYKLEL